jgi:hypothetical protein
LGGRDRGFEEGERTENMLDLTEVERRECGG